MYVAAVMFQPREATGCGSSPCGLFFGCGFMRVICMYERVRMGSSYGDGGKLRAVAWL